MPPLGCQSPSAFCDGCSPGQVFECDRCGKLQPYCMGCDDDQSESCDDCWVNPEGEAV
jgi:hypothetical protein